MRARQLLGAAMASAALLVPNALSAQAASALANDVPSGATSISSVPTTITQSTVDATTDATDAGLNEYCGAPATNGSVWFTYTDATGDGLLVDVSGSGFSAGAMIVEGDPTAGGTLVACGPGLTATRGAAGTTYYVMAFSDTPGVVGGDLVATFDKLPPAPTAALTISPRGTAYKDGSLKLSGTYSCTNGDWGSGIEGQVVQQVGRMKITGYLSMYGGLQCDGLVHPWETIVTSDNGLFAGGKAATVSVAFACGPIECAGGFAEQRVQISRNGK